MTAGRSSRRVRSSGLSPTGRSTDGTGRGADAAGSTRSRVAQHDLQDAAEKPSRRRMHARKARPGEGLVHFADARGRVLLAQGTDEDAGELFTPCGDGWERLRGAAPVEPLLHEAAQVLRAVESGLTVRIVTVESVGRVSGRPGEVLTAVPSDRWTNEQADLLAGARVALTLAGDAPTALESRNIRLLQTRAAVLSVQRRARARFLDVNAGQLQRSADAAIVKALVSPAAAKERLTAVAHNPMLVEGLIPAGLVVLVGRPDSGKSTIAAGLAAAVAAGARWVGRDAAVGAVLVVCGERGYSMQQRCDAAAARLGLQIGPTVQEVPWSLHGESADQSFRKLDQALDHMGAVRLLIIDTFGSLTPGMPETDAAAMSNLVGRFRRLMRDHKQLSVLLIHHPLKNGQGVRGHGSLEGAADAILELTSHRGLLRLTLQASNHLPAGVNHAFRLRADDAGVCFAEPLSGRSDVTGAAADHTRAAAQAGVAVELLLRAAKEAEGPVHWQHLAEAAGVGKTAFYSLVKELPELVVEPGMRGYYVYKSGDPR